MSETNALSQRATWILCAGPKCASLYRSRFAEEGCAFIRSVSAPGGGAAEWVSYLAEELDVLCGAGTNNRLVVCSPPEFRERLMGKLDGLTRECVEATLDTDFGGSPSGEELMTAVGRFVPSERALEAARKGVA